MHESEEDDANRLKLFLQISNISLGILCVMAMLFSFTCLSFDLLLSESLMSAMPFLKQPWNWSPHMKMAVTVAGALPALLGGGHCFGAWLYREWSGGGVWQFRWSLTILALILCLFLAGIAALGVTHQATWMTTSPEPILIWETPHAN